MVCLCVRVCVFMTERERGREWRDGGAQKAERIKREGLLFLSDLG